MKGAHSRSGAWPEHKFILRASANNVGLGMWSCLCVDVSSRVNNCKHGARRQVSAHLALSLDIYTSASRPPVGSNYSNSGARAIGLPGRRRERARVRRARKNNERANTNTVGQTPFGMNVPPICYIGPEINMRSEMVRARREIWALLPRRLGKCYSVCGLIW
jgi:hypothetical protein